MIMGSLLANCPGPLENYAQTSVGEDVPAIKPAETKYSLPIQKMQKSKNDHLRPRRLFTCAEKSLNETSNSFHDDRSHIGENTITD